MVKRLEAALGELRAAVFEAYAAIVEEGAKTGTEQQRRVAPAGHLLGHASRIA